MLPEALEDAVQGLLQERFGNAARILSASPVGGGCIHNGRHLRTSVGDFFLKYNDLAEEANFRAEVHGLLKLADAGSLAVPQPHGVGTTDAYAFLLMEFIPSGAKKGRFWQDFGAGLARIHRHQDSIFGLDRDNFIGRLPQSNRQHKLWADFFVDERLEPQLRLAEANGLAPVGLRGDFEQLYLRLPDLMPEEPPSLLHGDLWSGNFMVNQRGNAAIFDPAVYFGHREAEIAFTQMFGGFSAEFYTSYQAAWPLQPGWEERVDLFNLYPLTVHLNLFGSGYLPEIQSVLGRFL